MKFSTCGEFLRIGVRLRFAGFGIFPSASRFRFFRSSSEVSLGEIWYARVPNLVVRKLDVE